MSEHNPALMKAMEWVVDIDPITIIAEVARASARNPHMSKKKLAASFFSQARWKIIATGIVTGLPANPLIALPAATLDVATTLKMEVAAVASVAVIYDEHFFDDEDAVWELLIPIFGFNILSQSLREAGIRGGMHLTKAGIKKYLKKNTLKQFKKIMLKYFGKRVTQKGIMTKTVPIVGGVIGGAWNYMEVNRIKKRAIAYFEERHN